MTPEKWEGYKALAYLIEQSAHESKDPLIGQLYPKSHKHLTKYEGKHELQ